MKEASGYDCSLDRNAQVELPSAWLMEKLGLKWTGEEGIMRDTAGDIMAVDPSLFEPGPSSLLLAGAAAQRLERDTGYTLLWTFLGEKLMLGGSRKPNGYPGRMVFGGAFRLSKGHLIGGMSSHFYPPDVPWDR
jgi:hypothetical protein